MKLKRKIIYTLLLASFSASAIASPWPQSAADFAETTNQLPITISVLANDTGDSLTLKETNNWTQKGGRTVIVGDKIKYTPRAGFTGTDVFWYVFADSQNRRNSAKVSIDVTAGAASPWPQSAADFATSIGATPVTIPVLDNDTGVGLILKSSNDWTQNGGRTVIVGNKVKYTPPTNFSGTDAFWYNFADSQNRTNSAKVTVEVSASEGNSVVEFCGNTYETNGTTAGTRLTSLSPESPTPPPVQPEVVNGVITVGYLTYRVDGSGLIATNNSGDSWDVIRSWDGSSIEIIGGNETTKSTYFTIGRKLYSHNGSGALTVIAEDYFDLIPTGSSLGPLSSTAIKAVESATDDFYFAASANYAAGSFEVTSRIDSATGKAVEVGVSTSEAGFSFAARRTHDEFYYFNGLDYYGQLSAVNISGGSPNGYKIVQKNNGEISNSLDDAYPETYVEDRNRLFIVTQEIAARSGQNFSSPRIPSKLIVINGDNEFVELETCN